ncbi:MarR family winged helix-turn-helix transcriptional regulator [Tropicimonas sediminicola]|uniref:DNA-binding transcriptional regulator, MarR family n=1 Tax=Tropicimonas sediminicola TaxID=1031541 RepID=A0A239FR99_9RHOB|nr:MarR family transcriptional regulator [Tropicimonas sediminicola]SNS59431.1 DNA-binding transcriptional regulator, MarR family [Tropicimonas sediminicola]
MQLDSFFPYRLAVASETFSRKLTEVYQQGFGLSREEWRLLFLLSNAESLTSRELTSRGTLDKVQVTRAAQRLEDKGLISRAILDEDRRIRVYQCTPEGRALFASLLPQVEARAQAMLSAMSDEDRMALERGVSALLRAATET